MRKNYENYNIHISIDFTTLRTIGPAAALVLAAELDCWRLKRLIPIRVLDIEKWDLSIRYLLDEMGLFQLMKVVNQPAPINVERPPLYFIQFKSSEVAEGELATQLRSDLQALTGDIPGWHHLYGGLTEAMTNVRQHAYPETEQTKRYSRTNRWWMFGAYEKNRRQLTCVFFDRGVGIPATLPRTHSMERVRKFLERLGIPEDDGSLIAAATELGRTSTAASHQGRGLHDVKEFVERSTNGRLRILSRRGQFIYDGKNPDQASVLPASIGGTLIEWEISLD